MMKNNKPIWVIKLGSSLVSDFVSGRTDLLNGIGKQIVQIQKYHRVILVSSGAVALGMNDLGWEKRPQQLYRLQMAASVGQGILMHRYRQLFFEVGVTVAQILLTHDDFSNKKRYLNIQNTLNGLLDESVLPIVNENDVVSFLEIQFGDNDQLSAMLAGALLASRLIILTNQDGVYDHDPRINKDAKLIQSIKSDDLKLLEVANGKPSSFGSGGMLSKVLAAKLVGQLGIETVIASGEKPSVLLDVLNHVAIGTQVVPVYSKKV